jgi:HSP20 family molecular chaperone IbpA
MLVPRVFKELDEFLDWDRWSHLIRVEELQEDGAYKLRAEVPGMDAKDIKVSVDHGLLTIQAERTEERKGKHRSEFRYGSLHRTAALPVDAEEDKIRASYENGILEVIVPLGAKSPTEKVIPVEAAKQ